MNIDAIKNNNIRSVLFAASFYGSSHVSLPLKDAGSTTELGFRFRTARKEALLVLVAGRIDYCLVMLRNGVLKVGGPQYIFRS